MTKIEQRELANIIVMHKIGMTDTAARALSAMIRATRKASTRATLMSDAVMLGIVKHPEFII
jgi:hypothetical protein